MKLMREIRCSKQAWNDNIEIYIVDYFGGSKTMKVGSEVVFEEIEEGSYVPPTITIKNDTAQLLIDELWKCGVRPTEGSGSSGSLAATERHLSDMRNIAFASLNKQGVKVSND